MHEESCLPAGSQLSFNAACFPHKCPPAHFRTKSGFPGKNAVAAGQPV